MGIHLTRIREVYGEGRGRQVRPNRSTLLARCCHCIDARFARAVLAVYGTADRVPAAQGVSEEGAAQVRVTLKNSAQ